MLYQSPEKQIMSFLHIYIYEFSHFFLMRKTFRGHEVHFICFSRPDWHKPWMIDNEWVLWRKICLLAILYLILLFHRYHWVFPQNVFLHMVIIIQYSMHILIQNLSNIIAGSFPQLCAITLWSWQVNKKCNV